MVEFKSVYSVEEELFGDRLSDENREALRRKNVSDLRFYKWYLENRGTDESWSEMLHALVYYMNDMDRRASTEELDSIDAETLKNWRILLEEGPMGLAFSQFEDDEDDELLE